MIVSKPAWLRRLNADPLPWLLEDATPAVKHLALRQLFDRPADDREVTAAQAAAMQSEPIRSILANQQPAGFWVKPGAGYSPKYTGTVWQVIFLDQLGADPTHPQVQAACEYVLSHARTPSGGFGASGSHDTGSAPTDARVIHCLNGNLVTALIGLGWFDDPRVHGAIDWQARAIMDEDDVHYLHSGTPGPGFACSANAGRACAWGAIKAMLALSRVPKEARTPVVDRALLLGREFLLSRDPAKADYPMAPGNSRPSSSWFKLGFPSGYIADVLQNIEAIVALDAIDDPRVQPAIEWLLEKQDSDGRWKNEYAYNGKTWTDFESQGEPSKWVTLRACRVLKAVSHV